MPAIRATATASPLGTPVPRSSATTSGLTSTRPAAVASRAVTGLALTSTIRAAPVSSTWVSRGSVIPMSPWFAVGSLERSFDQHHVDLGAGGQFGHVLGDDDEAVCAGQVRHEVRAGPADLRDPAAVVPATQELPL